MLVQTSQGQSGSAHVVVLGNEKDGSGKSTAALGFRSIDGFAEREVYREFYPRGLTALDDLDEALGTSMKALATYSGIIHSG